jgi:hypothetical protein
MVQLSESACGAWPLGHSAACKLGARSASKEAAIPLLAPRAPESLAQIFPLVVKRMRTRVWLAVM